ncbi:hypothetical protein VE01_04357 [Pseudogymnoascus verrucosus]|uniref:Transcription factor domain-containing protein n=1 Tax=Pseudogymnoascus verrucosus TaxID=342668 RepID=A0A1B8GND7_9PEZI|nr:uncharacterized protein VE01_04357 [Pseudogymnoascus verrucosus]OBT97353.1 hypothetical protein VE01_04357 [Pseudogymnoascus verrucosus]
MHKRSAKPDGTNWPQVVAQFFESLEMAAPQITGSAAASSFISRHVRLQDPATINSAVSNLLCRYAGLADSSVVSLQGCALDLQEFYMANKQFVIGPTFVREFHSTLTSIYLSSPLLLEHTFLAILGALSEPHHRKSMVDQVYVKRGATGLEQLRTTHINSIHVAAGILLLGQSLATFDIFTTCMGSHMILRHSLTGVKPWYPALCREEWLHSITATPVLMDTVECLVKRQIPVIRFAPDLHRVDRFVGICSSFLPILYELCDLSNAASMAGSASAYGEASAYGDPAIFLGIEEKVRSWEPTIPSGFAENYFASEVLIMLTQARVYRLAALLVIHRLKNPFGVNDEIAEVYANAIVSDFKQCSTQLQGKTTMQNTSFPLLVAILEVTRECGDEILEMIPGPGISVAYLTKFVTFVNFIRSARENGFRGLWFDLVPKGPEICILP